MSLRKLEHPNNPLLKKLCYIDCDVLMRAIEDAMKLRFA